MAELQQQVETFINYSATVKQTKKATPETKAMRDNLKLMKETLKNNMKANNHQYFKLNDVYVVRETKYKQPALDKGFLARAYYEFTKDKKLSAGDPRQVAIRFGEGVFYARKKQKQPYEDLVITKKVPLTARLQEEFSF